MGVLVVSVPRALDGSSNPILATSAPVEMDFFQKENILFNDANSRVLSLISITSIISNRSQQF